MSGTVLSVPLQRVIPELIQPSAAGLGASASDDYSQYNPDLSSLPLEELDILGSSQASSPASVTDSITDQNSKSFERDSEFWFKGGDIVIVTQNTAFRLHKDVAARHSSVFRDLFSIPRPSPTGEEANETFDGYSVVRVSDTSYDFRELIRAMYDSIRYLNPDQPVTFPVLAALTRLSHKYELDELFEAVVYRLEGIFPTHLDVWDWRGGLDVHGPNRLSSAEVIEALNLLRLIDRPDMIPTALYRCAQLEPCSILCGEMRADGVTTERLSLSDMELCIKLKEKLLKVNACFLIRLHEACEARFREVYENVTDCLYPGTCKRGLRSAISKCLRDIRKYTSTDPLDVRYTPAAASSPLDGEMCRECGNVLKAAYSQERREIWRWLLKFTDVIVANWDSA